MVKSIFWIDQREVAPPLQLAGELNSTVATAHDEHLLVRMQLPTARKKGGFKLRLCGYLLNKQLVKAAGNLR